MDVPSDPDPWCNSYRAEALTVRVHMLPNTTTPPANASTAPNRTALTSNFGSPTRATYNDRHISFTVPPQANASGPQTPVWSASIGSYSLIKATVTNVLTGKSEPITLRAARLIGCGYQVQMETGATCYDIAKSQLKVEFLQSDNPALPAGHFTGSFTVNATGYYSHVQAARTIALEVWKYE